MWMGSEESALAGQLWWVIPVMIWDVTWKAVALWQAARNGQKNWYVALLLVNSVGILPMVYLKWFQKKG